MSMDFILGRNNLACTVFVPWDCQKSCSFCTIKKEYGKGDLSMKNTLDSLLRVIDSEPFKSGAIKEFVISGGEPLDNMRDLTRIINMLKPLNRPIYVNTSLPRKSVDTMSTLGPILDKIDGLNVSVHFDTHDIMEAAKLDKLVMWSSKIKINCIVPDLDKVSESDIALYIELMEDRCGSISFRADYRKIYGVNDLKGMDDRFFNRLVNIAQYLGSSGCSVCNDDMFVGGKYKTRIIYYHRGYEHSAIRFDHSVVVNDVIIQPNGKITLDWDPDCDCLQAVVDDFLRQGFSYLNMIRGPESNAVYECPLRNRKVVYERLSGCHGFSFSPIDFKGCPYLGKLLYTSAPTGVCGRSEYTPVDPLLLEGKRLSKDSRRDDVK